LLHIFLLWVAVAEFFEILFSRYALPSSAFYWFLWHYAACHKIAQRFY